MVLCPQTVDAIPMGVTAARDPPVTAVGRRPWRCLWKRYCCER